MFDIGFWELVVVGVVALIVVGPERLPGLARTVGRWVGRARRFVSTVKADVEREVRQEELQKILNKQNEFRSAYEIIEETRETLKDTGDTVRQAAHTPLAAPGVKDPEPMADPTAAEPSGPARNPAEPEHGRKP